MDGTILKELRKSIKMTQAELGQALDLTPSYIGEMERGAKVIDRRTELSILYLTGSQFLPRLITEVNTRHGTLLVTKIDDRYTISINHDVKHLGILADEVIGAMGHYLHGAEYSLMKIEKAKPDG